ncbi:YdcF family protein [Parafrankia sp. EUN1f]|uniref:YdcF family protein n=1 Tax=Parafrankia sp. EUN1f TaxID=102897 RepID=UPI0005666B9B|nr:YdcF family protein [Parafrankia sp. EUN1f]
MDLSFRRLLPRPPSAAWFRVAWWRWAVRIVLMAVALLLVGSAATFGQVWWVGRGDDRRASDTLIVLGASQYDGRPSAILAARLDHALELYRAGVAPRVITVGGNQPGDRFTEAEVAATYLRDHGVPASAVLAVPQGRDTLSSMIAVAGLMDSRHWGSAVVVTDRWHSLRSRTIAADLGIAAVASPSTSGPANRGFGTQVHYILREGIGYRFYQLFHRASPAAAHTPAV